MEKNQLKQVIKLLLEDQYTKLQEINERIQKIEYTLEYMEFTNQDLKSLLEKGEWQQLGIEK